MINKIVLNSKRAGKTYSCSLCGMSIVRGEKYIPLNGAAKTHRFCEKHSYDQIERFVQALREAGFRSWRNGIPHYQIGRKRRTKRERINFIRDLGSQIAEANVLGREFDASEFARKHGVDKTTVTRAIAQAGLSAARPGATWADPRNHSEIIRLVQGIISQEDPRNTYFDHQLASMVNYGGTDRNFRIILRNAGIPTRSQRRLSIP